MNTTTAFLARNLDEQGFGYLDDTAKVHCVRALRFTPGVSVVLIVGALAFQSRLALGGIALIAASGALMPKAMPIDVLYNAVVRHLLRTAPLPPTPKPRQFSYLISTALLTGSALSFYLGFPMLGFLLGGTVAIAATILTVTLFCLGSWIYGLFSVDRTAARK